MSLDAKLDLARKAAETYFAFAGADPAVAQEAMVTAAQEHSRIYMDYLQQLTRLNEELADRILDASNRSLLESLQTKRRQRKRRRRSGANRSSGPRKASRPTRTTRRSRMTRRVRATERRS
jgi:hypothetical protein